MHEAQKDRLDEIIYNYIDTLLPTELTFYYYGDDTSYADITNDTTHISAEDENDETVLRVYLENYFDNKELWGDSLPMIELELTYDRSLTDMFGKTRWHDAFLKWVNHNFPELNKVNIKSVGG